jgi:dienelactone hydrolase
MKGLTAALVSSLMVLTACSPTADEKSASEKAAITVDQPVSLADQAVHLGVSGLRSREQVTIESRATDVHGEQWHAEAMYAADKSGRIDLDHATPVTGSYEGVDGMGLFWSMNPIDGDPDQSSFVPPLKDDKPTAEIQFSVRSGDKTLATSTLTRRWLTDSVTVKRLTLSAHKVDGYLFKPPGSAKHPAVLLFGGSEGGIGSLPTASLLASHGYPVLVLAYFHDTGLPTQLKNIPLEYFAAAARLLAPSKVIAATASRGTEAALLLAQYFPDLIQGAVLWAPSAITNPSFPIEDSDAWTLHGKPIPTGTLIPVDHVHGPILAIAGADDQLWQSATAAPLISKELDAAHVQFPHQALVYPQAGHGIAGAPYVPRGTHLAHPVTKQVIAMGGSRPANEAATLQSWTKILQLLKDA